MDEGRLENKEGAPGERCLIRDVRDANMKRIRERVAGRPGADATKLLRHPAYRNRPDGRKT